ncbi:MAG: hypothetical protein ABFS42_03920 [Candidatus Krumholzibacteriota bacterium]
MKKGVMLMAGFILFVLAATALAGEFIETFDDDSGPWSNSPNEGYLVAEGGNPGPYISMVSSFGAFRSNPMPRTFRGTAPQWVGDYRVAGVTSVGIDVLVLGSQAKYDSPGSLFLYSNMGTGDSRDDQVIFYLTDRLPAPGEGWVSFDAPLDLTADSLPRGWRFGDPTPHDPEPAFDFEALIRNITTVGFLFCSFDDQTNLGFTNVGIDNPRLTFERAPSMGAGESEDPAKANLGTPGNFWFDMWHESER